MWGVKKWQEVQILLDKIWSSNIVKKKKNDSEAVRVANKYSKTEAWWM